MYGFILSIPVIGCYMSYFTFCGGFPGHPIIPRFYSVRTLLLPAIIVGLFTAHIIMVEDRWPLRLPRTLDHRRHAGAAPTGSTTQCSDARWTWYGDAAFYTVTFVACGDDMMAVRLHLSIEEIINVMRVSAFIFPVLRAVEAAAVDREDTSFGQPHGGAEEIDETSAYGKTSPPEKTSVESTAEGAATPCAPE